MLIDTRNFASYGSLSFILVSIFIDNCVETFCKVAIWPSIVYIAGNNERTFLNRLNSVDLFLHEC